ncbi:hypothetical protein HZS_131 [Henneguya salminicola]|nr:hypothetical protein HZS_131 [Henneguya salminicola]
MVKDRKTFKTVIFAVDDETHTKNAFDYFTKYLHDSKDQITLLNVFVPPTMTTDMFIKEDFKSKSDLEANKIALERYENSKRILDSYLKKCREMKLHCKKELIYKEEDKKISDSISDYTKTKGDLIVMGSGKHSFMERVLLGCVAANTVQKSTIPVLIIPPRKEEEYK